MRMALLFSMILTLTGPVEAQSERSLVNGGNDLYEQGKYDEAEIRYRKALKENEQSLPGRFNLGNALHKQGKLDQSASEFGQAAEGAADSETRSGALYNRGNSLLDAKDYETAIASYREALKLNPHDEDAKYNLSYALSMRQQQQNSNQNQQKQQEQKDQQQKDQQQKNDQQQQDRKDQNRDQQQRQEGENPPEDRNQPQPPKMSRAEAERILEVLKNSEKETQKDLRAKVQQETRSEKDW